MGKKKNKKFVDALSEWLVDEGKFYLEKLYAELYANGDGDMAIGQCYYCSTNTAGEHEQGCPANLAELAAQGAKLTKIWGCPIVEGNLPEQEIVFGKPSDFYKRPLFGQVFFDDTLGDCEVRIVSPTSVRVELLDSKVADGAIVITYRVRSNE